MKTRILMYVYGDISTDARVQRAANALKKDFDVTLVSTQKHKKIPEFDFESILVGGRFSNSMLDFFDTIWQTWKIVKKQKPSILYCHDYYSALLARLFLGRKDCKKIIYDAHELIIPEKGVKFTLRSRFIYNNEKNIIKKVDLLLCASDKRGEIMKIHYNLQILPITIRNISQLSVNNCDEKTQDIINSLKDFFAKPGYTVVYAGVVNRSRRIDELVDAVSFLSDKCKLLVVGDGDFIHELQTKSKKYPELVSYFTGKVPYSSLGSILSLCDIGFIYYPNDTLNNINCASNKIYEYASVNLPIVANNNPIIKKDLDTYRIGVASDNFIEALTTIIPQLSSFKSNCKEYNNVFKWEKEEEILRNSVNRLKV